MKILISIAFLLVLTINPAFAAESDPDFGGNYFANSQLPGFSDPVMSNDMDAAGLANIEPAAGDDMQIDEAEDGMPVQTQHETAPTMPTDGIETLVEEDEI